MKRLLSIVQTLLGLLFAAVAFVGRGVTSLLNRPLSSGVSKSATCAEHTSEVSKHASTILSPLWSPAQGLPDGTYSFNDSSFIREDGKLYAHTAMSGRPPKNMMNDSIIESVAREFMKDNQGLMKDLTMLEEQEKLQPKKDSSSQGLKYDASKPCLDLIPREALESLGEALTYGAKKYERANWAKGIQQSRLIAAALRHLTAYSSGEDRDPESGLNHISHALCNLAFLTYMQKNRRDMDDRWSKK